MTAHQHQKMLQCQNEGKNYKLTVTCPGGSKPVKQAKSPKPAIQKVKRIAKIKEVSENAFVRRVKEVIRYYGIVEKKLIGPLKKGDDAVEAYISMRLSQGVHGGREHAKDLLRRDMNDVERIPTKVGYFKRKAK